MKREIYGWYSDRLGIHMPVARYGHAGKPLLIFPTWQSDYLESERQGLISAVGDLVDSGRVIIFCIDSASPIAWCLDGLPAQEKVRRQGLHSRYVEEEVVPHIRDVVGDRSARLAVGGASFGAFFAANAMFRRPDQFWALLGMSGFYDLGSKLDGFANDEAYFNNPGWFVPNLSGEPLRLLQESSRVELMTGQGAHEYPAASVRFSQLLSAKGIPNRLDLWGHDMAHDWPTWRKMIRIGLEERLGF